MKFTEALVASIGAINWRGAIANCFGRHSRRIWRCIVGASWALPLRYITMTAQLAVIASVPGVLLQVPAHAIFRQ